MKIYVAAKFEEAPLARATMDALESSGHTITHDWTHEDVGGRTGAELREYLGACAHGDLEGVLAAEAILLLHHDRLAGGLVEYGLALSNPNRVIVVAGAQHAARRCIFYDLPRVRHVASALEGVQYLNDLERRVMENAA